MPNKLVIATGSGLIVTLSIIGATLNMHVEPQHLAIAGFVTLAIVGCLALIGKHIFLSFEYTHWPYVVAASLIFPFLVLRQYFGPFSLAALIFHLSDGVSGAAPSGVAMSLLAASFLYGGTFFAVHQLLTYRRRKSFTLNSLALLLLVGNPVAIEKTRDIYWWASSGDVEVAEFYNETSPIKLSTATPDVIFIYLEGTERTYSQLGSAYDPILSLEAEAIAFTNVSQLPYTEWTTAGIVASQCGVPLLPRGLIQHNKLEAVDAIYPNLTCLGDVLRGDGYQNILVLGSDETFGGQSSFYTRHGQFEIIDRHDLSMMGATDQNSWGYNDGEVFNAAFRVLSDRRGDAAPVFLNIQTLGPHAPQGFLSSGCASEGNDQIPETILEAVACTSALTLNFIRHVQKEFTEREMFFVVVSDHLAHPTVSAIGDLMKLDRRNTALILGSERGVTIQKLGTMIDLYPTVLELLGYQLTDNRAGIGVSLLSDQLGFMSGQSYWQSKYFLGSDREFSELLWE